MAAYSSKEIAKQVAEARSGGWEVLHLFTSKVQESDLLNSGEMVPRDTPDQNIRAYVETLHVIWTKTIQSE